MGFVYTSAALAGIYEEAGAYEQGVFVILLHI